MLLSVGAGFICPSAAARYWMELLTATELFNYVFCNSACSNEKKIDRIGLSKCVGDDGQIPCMHRKLAYQVTLRSRRSALSFSPQM